MDKKICKNCGAAMPLESKFCTECGTSFPKEKKEEAPKQEQWDPENEITVTVPKNPWSAEDGDKAPVKPSPLDNSDVKTVYLEPDEIEETVSVLPNWTSRPADKPEDQQFSQSAARPNADANARPDPRGAAQYGAQQAKQYGRQPDGQPGNQYAAQPGSQPGSQAGGQRANQYGGQFDGQYGSQYGAQPGNQYGAQAGSQAGRVQYGGNQMITEDRLAGTELEPLSSLGWFGVNVLMNIPVVNLIIAAIWSCGGAFRKARRSFARGWLMNFLLIVILCAGAVLALSFFAGSNDQPFTFFKDIGNAFLKPFGYEIAS